VFWYNAGNPSIWIGGLWTPVGIQGLRASGLPIVNTLLLLRSGSFLTFAHARINLHSRRLQYVTYSFVPVGLSKATYEYFSKLLSIAVGLGCLFTIFQLCEYYITSFNFSDSIYGSIFFRLTGLHGLHVLVGTIRLSSQIFSIFNNCFNSSHHNRFIRSVWYWHFVDLVWLFVFRIVYVWGNSIYRMV